MTKNIKATDESQIVEIQMTDRNIEHNKEYRVRNRDNTGSAVSLGFFVFGGTTILAALRNTTAYSSSTGFSSMGILAGGFTQLLVGIFEWIKGFSNSGVIFMGYGIYWISAILLNFLPVWNLTPQIEKNDLGCFGVVWTFFALIVLFGSFNVPWANLIMNIDVVLTFIMGTISGFTGKEGINKAYGYFGVSTSIIAFYIFSAIYLNEAYQKIILPLGAKGEKWLAKTEKTE